MTCSKDCQRCIYGLRIPTYKCGDKNVTCNGECHKCPFRIEESVKYVCGMCNMYGDSTNREREEVKWE